MLSKSQILQVVDLKTETVDVPEWGGPVLVREMSGTDLDAYQSSMLTITADGKREANISNATVKLVAQSLIDAETGERMFTPEEVHLLGAKSGVVLQRIATVAQRLNGMGAQAVEDAAKNSSAAPSGSSTSDSASPSASPSA